MNAAPVAHAQANETGRTESLSDFGGFAVSGQTLNSEREPTRADEDTDGAPPDNLVQFPVKSKRGRPRKSGDDCRVSVEQVSKHTYAVRLRWTRADGSEDGCVVNRLRDDIVKEIKRSKKRYEQFKTQTLISWKSRAVRESHGA